MNVPQALSEARRRAGLSQSALAARAGTSQATISAYESGRKLPSLNTLARLLAVTGFRLAIEPGAAREPSRKEHESTAKVLADVLALAEALPARHGRELEYPRLAA